jgi:hypothetical protein
MGDCFAKKCSWQTHGKPGEFGKTLKKKLDNSFNLEEAGRRRNE